METKRCSKCKKMKPLEEFNRQIASKDGRHYYCKQCMKEYMRQRRADNPEYMRQYYVKNREKIKRLNMQWHADNPDYQRQYYIDHHEEAKAYAREYSRQYRIDHPEKVKKCNQEYYVNHCEEVAENVRRYRADYPERMVVYTQRRRAREAGATGDFTAEQFTELCEKYDNRCLCCGETKKLTADHIIPLSKGGSNDIDNIQPLCQSCNSKKHTQTTNYQDTKENEE